LRVSSIAHRASILTLLPQVAVTAAAASVTAAVGRAVGTARGCRLGDERSDLYVADGVQL